MAGHRASPGGRWERPWSWEGRLPGSTAPLTGAGGQPCLWSVWEGASLRAQGGAGAQTPRLFTAAWSSGSPRGPGPARGTWPGRALCGTPAALRDAPPGATGGGWVSGLAVRAALSVLLSLDLQWLLLPAAARPALPAEGKGLCAGPEAGGRSRSPPNWPSFGKAPARRQLLARPPLCRGTCQQAGA